MFNVSIGDEEFWRRSFFRTLTSWLLFRNCAASGLIL